MVPGKRAEYAEATKRDLIEVGRRLFGDRGFAATSLDDVVAEAGVTKGALYHHFTNKKELFVAVVEKIEGDLSAFIAQGMERDPWAALLVGIDRYLDAALEPEVQMVLLDAPAVLGWERWRQLEERYGLGLTMVALQVAMEAGVLTTQPIEPLAHLVLGALNEGAIYIAQAKDRDAARRVVGEAARSMLKGLKA